jgi:hypothetical protein
MKTAAAAPAVVNHPEPEITIEVRVAALETLVYQLITEIDGLKTAPVDKADWPRRCCNATGCATIMRATNAADLPPFCPEHTVPADDTASVPTG